MKKLTTSIFIERANAKHGGKYSYANANYTGSHAVLTVTCATHGDFEQVANQHLAGYGCIKCTGRGKTVAELIDDARAIHGDRYDYSKFVPLPAHFKVEIGCNRHGSFHQSWSNHVNNKQGCPSCGVESQTLSRSKTNDDFIKQAKEVHGDQYDYSVTNYINSTTKVDIGCRVHGIFKQPPFSHLGGRGCKRCNIAKSKVEKAWLDSLGIKERQFTIMVNGKRFLVDGYEPLTNSIYEFNGDYWHGNPKVFDSNSMHPLMSKTFGQLYQDTLDKERILKEAGYNVITMWEADWRKSH